MRLGSKSDAFHREGQTWYDFFIYQNQTNMYVYCSKWVCETCGGES